ncbi:MAG TPA: DUF488 domain-containing protein [Thermoanaerobaculia bacterium]|nr:DUF488 domain-containing protein [Thermoanaerobaculia bacterium]
MTTIWTVGHSNHALEKFIQILKAHEIERVVDVRRFPVSRKWPHFNAEGLAASLPAAGIDYAGMPELGGRRKPRPDSPHTAWRVDQFRGYADFMDTPEFGEWLGRTMALARERRSALLCAEALPWRCHRSILSDTFLARGWEVREILNEKDARPRNLPGFARLDGDRVIYDGGDSPREKASSTA